MSEDNATRTPRASERKSSSPAAEPTGAPSTMVDFRAECPTSFYVEGPGMVVLEPGLNIVEHATWPVLSKHPAIESSDGVERIELAKLTVEQRADLIARTTNRAALELLLATETAKPLIAGPANRRDPATVSALKRKLAKIRSKPVKPPAKV
jgi:hypothetical protein